jgi:hypothetical protein
MPFYFYIDCHIKTIIPILPTINQIFRKKVENHSASKTITLGNFIVILVVFPYQFTTKNKPHPHKTKKKPTPLRKSKFNSDLTDIRIDRRAKRIPAPDIAKKCH